MQTVADIFLARRADPDPALYFEERHWSGAAVFGECAARAAFLLAERPAGAFHVGVLLDNTPEQFAAWLAGESSGIAELIRKKGISPN